MADFITNDVSLDRHGRNDGWFVQPADGRPFLFLSTEEVDALVAWRTGTGIWSSSEPPSIVDMALGTTFTARLLHSAEDRRWMVTTHGLASSDGSAGVDPRWIDPSTVRDVTPTKDAS